MTSRPTPPYDPELAPALAAFHGMTGMPRSITPEWLAQQPTHGSRPAVPPEIVEASAEERTIPRPSGETSIEVAILRPAQSARNPLPGALFIHGGGMIGGSRYDGLDQTLEWIDAVPMVVVSVEYRLAPGHPHPAPLDDCYATLCWMRDNAAELGIDHEKLIVSGASAGGGLAAATALRARDSDGPALAGQLLICPCSTTDLATRQAPPTKVTASGTASPTPPAGQR